MSQGVVESEEALSEHDTQNGGSVQQLGQMRTSSADQTPLSVERFSPGHLATVNIASIPRPIESETSPSQAQLASRTPGLPRDRKQHTLLTHSDLTTPIKQQRMTPPARNSIIQELTSSLRNIKNNSQVWSEEPATKGVRSMIREANRRSLTSKGLRQEPLDSPQFELSDSSPSNRSQRPKRASNGPEHRGAPESQDSVHGTIRVKSAHWRDLSDDASTVPINETRTPYVPKSRSIVHGTTEESDLAGNEESDMVAIPVLSARSMRSTTASTQEWKKASSPGNEIRVLFASSSTANHTEQFKLFLTGKGVRIVDSAPDSTILCVGSAGLKRTSKLIMAVMMGKQVISDEWITCSVRADKILEVDGFKARDAVKEKNWNVNLDEAVERGKSGLKVLSGWTILFTPSAKKVIGTSGFGELRSISMMAGATKFSELPKKIPEILPDTLIIATEEDSARHKLMDQRCFASEIIGLSILRGTIDTDSDEFLIMRQTPERGKKRKRKSRDLI